MDLVDITLILDSTIRLAVPLILACLAGLTRRIHLSIHAFALVAVLFLSWILGGWCCGVPR